MPGRQGRAPNLWSSSGTDKDPLPARGLCTISIPVQEEDDATEHPNQKSLSQ